MHSRSSTGYPPLEQWSSDKLKNEPNQDFGWSLPISSMIHTWPTPFGCVHPHIPTLTDLAFQHNPEHRFSILLLVGAPSRLKMGKAIPHKPSCGGKMQGGGSENGASRGRGWTAVAYKFQTATHDCNCLPVHDSILVASLNRPIVTQ